MALEPLTTSWAWLQGQCAGFDGETTCDRPRGHDGPCRLHDPNGSSRWIDKDDEGLEVGRGPLLDAAWMAESPLRRRQHPFGEDPLSAVSATHRDQCRGCGLVRAAFQHHDSEVAAGRDWQRLTTLDGLLGPRPPGMVPQAVGDAAKAAFTRREVRLPGTVRVEESARSRPPSCGDVLELGVVAGLARVCGLEVGHEGMHRADDGAEWARTRPAAEVLRDLAAERAANLPAAEAVALMRVGRKVGRTLYLQVGPEPSDCDVLVGMMDTPELAADVARRWNGVSP